MRCCATRPCSSSRAPSPRVDDDTKALLDDTYARVLPKRTVVFLPHRISTLKNCDRVFLIHKGQVEAAGEHAGLLAHHDLYKHLHYSNSIVRGTDLIDSVTELTGALAACRQCTGRQAAVAPYSEFACLRGSGWHVAETRIVLFAARIYYNAFFRCCTRTTHLAPWLTNKNSRQLSTLPTPGKAISEQYARFEVIPDAPASITRR